MDITAWNNERFVVSRDCTAFQAAYELAGVSWKMQVRRTADTAPVYLEMSTANGRAFYSGGVVTFTAPLSEISKMSGDYVWDYGFSPPGGEFQRCEGGDLKMNNGVTR